MQTQPSSCAPAVGHHHHHHQLGQTGGVVKEEVRGRGQTAPSNGSSKMLLQAVSASAMAVNMRASATHQAYTTPGSLYTNRPLNALTDDNDITLESQQLWLKEDGGGARQDVKPGEEVIDGIQQYWYMQGAGVGEGIATGHGSGVTQPTGHLRGAGVRAHAGTPLTPERGKTLPYDLCIFYKTSTHGHQLTVALHMDDMLVTFVSQSELDRFRDRILAKQVTPEVLEGGGVATAHAIPATCAMFDTRESAPKLGQSNHDSFRSYVLKILYLSRRARPETLTAIVFLSTRVQCSDADDLAKLKRVLGYLYGCPDRGIALIIGDEGIKVASHIDAAYGVYTASGKSHTGCTISLGQGSVYVKSAKQKIVTKASTEAELVGLSDTASQGLYIRNLVEAQGYTTGPMVMYQDNMSCLALIKRGDPCSGRSRHIGIRRFWLKERADNAELVMEHKRAEDMFVNALTKPVQGRQFLTERQGLTDWDRQIGAHR